MKFDKETQKFSITAEDFRRAGKTGTVLRATLVNMGVISVEEFFSGPHRVDCCWASEQLREEN